MSSNEEVVTVFVPYGQVVLPAETVQRLDEWGRWNRVGSLEPHGRCASAEGRFDPRYPDEKRSTSLAVDLRTVLAVERVVTTRLPQLDRSLLKRHFVNKAPPLQVARALGINRARYGQELKRAVLMVRNNLTMQKFRV